MTASRSSHLLSGLEGTPRRTGSKISMAGLSNKMRRKTSVKGIIRRTCSIQVDPGDMPGRCR